MKKIQTLISRIAIGTITLLMGLSMVPAAHAQYLGVNGRIVYGGIGDTLGLATIMPDGSNIHVHGTMQNLSSRRFAVYSPDGTQFAWSQVIAGTPNQSDIYTGAVASAVTGTARTNDVATNDLDPYYSADGSRIVFTRETIAGGAEEIWVMNADGTGQTQLTNQIQGGDSSMAVFDPTDANNLYVIVSGGSADGIYRISSTTANQNTGTLIFTSTVGGSSDPVFLDVSPDGSTLLYVVTNTTTTFEQIRSVSTAGAGDAAVSQDNAQNYTTAAYSPDGTRIASEKCGDCIDDESIAVMLTPNGANETAILTSTPQNDVILSSVSYWGTSTVTYSDQGNSGGTGTPGAPNTTATKAEKNSPTPWILVGLMALVMLGLGGFWVKKELKGKR